MLLMYFPVLAVLALLALNFECDGKSDFISVDPRYIRHDRRSIFWMHIQKTSSWIGNFLAVWACPNFCLEMLLDRLERRDRGVEHKDNKILSNSTPSILITASFDYFASIDNYINVQYSVNDNNMVMKSSLMNCSVNFDGHSSGMGWHLSYNDQRMNHSIVTLFRNPTNRIISAFLFDMLIPYGFPNKTIEERLAVKALVRATENPIYSYATLPGISSCQTKMVLGYGCGEHIRLSYDHLVEAKRRLNEDFYFIGLTEESEASANLFLAMHYNDGGPPERKSIEEMVNPPFIFPSLRRNKMHDRSSHHNLLRDLNALGWKDDFDEAIYIEAATIFYTNCRKYNVKTTKDLASIF